MDSISAISLPAQSALLSVSFNNCKQNDFTSFENNPLSKEAYIGSAPCVPETIKNQVESSVEIFIRESNMDLPEVSQGLKKTTENSQWLGRRMQFVQIQHLPSTFFQSRYYQPLLWSTSSEHQIVYQKFL